MSCCVCKQIKTKREYHPAEWRKTIKWCKTCISASWVKEKSPGYCFICHSVKPKCDFYPAEWRKKEDRWCKKCIEDSWIKEQEELKKEPDIQRMLLLLDRDPSLAQRVLNKCKESSSCVSVPPPPEEDALPEEPLIALEPAVTATQNEHRPPRADFAQQQQTMNYWGGHEGQVQFPPSAAAANYNYWGPCHQAQQQGVRNWKTSSGNNGWKTSDTTSWNFDNKQNYYWRDESAKLLYNI